MRSNRKSTSFNDFQRIGVMVATALACVMGFAAAAEARVTRIVISRIESPTFEGVSFGDVGQYEKLVGRAFGEIDPGDPQNARITDIAPAPRNAQGMVEYSTDVYILTPVQRARGNHRVFFEINNRGNSFSLNEMNDATTGGNDPTTAADAGNGFLMRAGYTIVLSGWDVTVPAGGGRFTMTVPVARNADGSPIVGSSLEEFVVDNGVTVSATLTYAAATLDKTQASLTLRSHYVDPPVVIPPTAWEYINARAIRLVPAGTPFQNGSLYEFTYPATNPLVAGLAFAGLRDLAAFIRHATTDDMGTMNPLAGAVHRIYSFSFSQPTRFMHDFLRLGFNEDEDGRPVFDANLNWIGGASGGFFNYRFAQPARTHRQHIGRWYPEIQFPFTNEVLFDPVTGTSDGVLRACSATRTCPKIFEVNSENEYWSKGGSLLHTDTLGNDLPLDRHEHGEKGRDGSHHDDDENVSDVRYYLLSSLPHSAGSGPTGRGICQQPRNPLVANPTLRALLVALDAWVTDDEEPPESAVPRRADGHLSLRYRRTASVFPTSLASRTTVGYTRETCSTSARLSNAVY